MADREKLPPGTWLIRALCALYHLASLLPHLLGQTLHARLFIAQFSKGVVGIAEFLLLVRQFLLCRCELFFESGDLAEYDFVVLLVGSQLRIECCNLRFNLNAFGRKVFDYRCQTFHAMLCDVDLLVQHTDLTLLILEV